MTTKTKTKTTEAAGPKMEPATTEVAIGAAYLRFRRLEREWNDTKARDPHDMQIAFGRQGPLTQERDRALGDVQRLADRVIDSD